MMIGYPGSGKSTLALQLKNGQPVGTVEILDGDTLSTSKKIVKELKRCLDSGKSVIVDACNHTLERRQDIINECKSRNIQVYGLWIMKSMEESMAQAAKREEDLRASGDPNPKHISRIAYYTIRKNYVPPTMDEGFTGITSI